MPKSTSRKNPTDADDLEHQLLGALMLYERIRISESDRVEAYIERTVTSMVVVAKRAAGSRGFAPEQILEEARTTLFNSVSTAEAAAVLREIEGISDHTPVAPLFEAALAYLAIEAASDHSTVAGARTRYRAGIREVRVWMLPEVLTPRLLRVLKDADGHCLFDLAAFGGPL